MTFLTNSRPRRSVLAPARSRFSPFALLALRRQRRALAALDAHLLEDIGITEAEAQAEARRAAWDVPASWRA